MSETGRNTRGTGVLHLLTLHQLTNPVPLHPLDREGQRQNRKQTPQRAFKAALYNEWINNDHQVRALLAEMRKLAAKAQQLILEQTTH